MNITLTGYSQGQEDKARTEGSTLTGPDDTPEGLRHGQRDLRLSAWDGIQLGGAVLLRVEFSEA